MPVNLDEGLQFEAVDCRQIGTIALHEGKQGLVPHDGESFVALVLFANVLIVIVFRVWILSKSACGF